MEISYVRFIARRYSVFTRLFLSDQSFLERLD
jgi:hypothetical protein